MDSHIPYGSRIFDEYEGPYLRSRRYVIYEVGPKGVIKKADAPSEYYIPKSSVSKAADVNDVAQVAEYVILGGFRKRLLAESKRHEAELEKYDALLLHYDLVKTIKQFSIYRRKHN
jgi:hypothetical protein